MRRRRRVSGSKGERRTFARDQRYVLYKNHQTGTADKSRIPSRLGMFTFAKGKVGSGTERKKKLKGCRGLVAVLGVGLGVGLGVRRAVPNRTESLPEFSRNRAPSDAGWMPGNMRGVWGAWARNASRKMCIKGWVALASLGVGVWICRCTRAYWEGARVSGLAQRIVQCLL